MSLAGKKILVTGAGGFIGSHLTEELIRNGCDVRAFVFYNAYHSWEWLDHLPGEIKQNLDVYSGDIREPYDVKEAMRERDVVFHLAALVSIPYSYRSPAAYVETNVKGTLNVLMAARELEVEKLIHTSTSEVYGSALYVPIGEGHPLQAQSPYSASKIAADQMALSFHYSYDLPVSIIRPFNTYGPRQSARAVIPTVITQLAAGRRKIHLGALHPTRDFVYVNDTVSGFLAAAASAASIGEVINIGCNYEISIRDTALLIAELMGVSAEFVFDRRRVRPERSEVAQLRADHAKAGSLLGWSPVYKGLSGLRRGLENTIGWFTRLENLQRYKAGLYQI